MGQIRDVIHPEVYQSRRLLRARPSSQSCQAAENRYPLSLGLDIEFVSAENAALAHEVWAVPNRIALHLPVHPGVPLQLS